MIDFNDYQYRCVQTAIYPNVGSNIIYPTLGLAGEAGEVAELIKKTIRDHNGELTDERRAKLERELGDVLWYIAMIGMEAGITLASIADTNLKKLSERQTANLLQGEGSDR